MKTARPRSPRCTVRGALRALRVLETHVDTLHAAGAPRFRLRSAGALEALHRDLTLLAQQIEREAA